MGQIRRDLPNDEYQAAVGANNASASNVFATINDLTGAGGIEHGVAAGTNTYTVAIPGVVSYTDGDSYVVRFTNGSDADSTININGLGAITLTKQPGIQVTGGDIIAGQEMILIYDGTNFQCIGVAPNQLFAYVTNDEAITITKGQPVYAFGATGNRMSVKLAFNTSDATSAQTVGVVYSSSIAANQRGFIIVQGVVGGLNTSMYAPGDQLYLGATAGSLTNVKPYAPNHLVYIGIVERANAGNGQIYVRTQNGYELDELHDVDITTTPPADGEVLTYDGVSGLWKNEPPNSTPTNQVVLFADLATTEALKACTYSNGTLGVGATLIGNVNGQLSTVSFTDRIDNVVTALNQIILVKNQSNQTQNGIYVVTQLGSPTQPFIITRTTDADTQAELYPLQVNVFGGATLAYLAFLQKTVDPVVGTNNIVFTTTVLGIQNTPVLHVDTVTSAALPACTYTSGANPTLPGSGAFLEANVNGILPAINGVTLTAGRRFLVKDQVNQAHNGTYAVSSVGSASTRWRLTRVDAWGSNFTVLDREWKVNNPSSTKYGARYSTNLLSLANTAIGTTNIIFTEIYSVPTTRNITINGTTQDLSADRTYTVTDANLSTSDITTNDVSTAKHGFAPKAPNDTAKFLRGDGTWAVPSAGGLTNFTEAANSSAPNATVPVNSLTPVTATTNADFAIVPKGSGALLAAIPDGTSTGGNKRGINALDLQMSRSSQALVASGNFSAILGGSNNMASGANSVVAGTGNSANGTPSVAIGQNNSSTNTNSYSFGNENLSNGVNSYSIGRYNNASGASAVAIGGSISTYNLASGTRSVAIGESNTASGTNAIAIGLNADTQNIYGRRSFANGRFANNGDAQSSKIILRCLTSGATNTVMTSDGASPSLTNQVILSNQSAYRFKGTIVAKREGSTDCASWDFNGFIVRGANAASTLLIGSSVAVSSIWNLVPNTPTVTVDTTNGGLTITAKGVTVALQNVRWVATIETTEVIYA